MRSDAEVVRDASGRVIFTEAMKDTHTILVPMMLPIHFKLIQRLLLADGYRVEVLTTQGPSIVDTGLKYTHNDACYPAQLTIGQLMDAAQNGGYDTNKIALLLMQTGGGCRASNYVSMLRKGLKKAGMEHIPVISFNLLGMEENPGFVIDFKMIKKLATAVLYGDVLMNLHNQMLPYEHEKGTTEAKVEHWADDLCNQFSHGYGLSKKDILKNTQAILADFDKISRSREKKVRVGIVGEIYIKFAPLGNNNLEAFLRSEDCEVVVPGLMDFILYTIDAGIEDHRLYGTGLAKKIISLFLFRKIIALQNMIIAAYGDFPDLVPQAPFLQTKAYGASVINVGTKMGEGWLLTAEMMELIQAGVRNIVCTQPFGCLPNHIVGRGMVRKIKELHPEANIVAIDYDASATRVNQENRIKLMLAQAKNII